MRIHGWISKCEGIELMISDSKELLRLLTLVRMMKDASVQLNLIYFFNEYRIKKKMDT